MNIQSLVLKDAKRAPRVRIDELIWKEPCFVRITKISWGENMRENPSIYIYTGSWFLRCHCRKLRSRYVALALVFTGSWTWNRKLRGRFISLINNAFFHVSRTRCLTRIKNSDSCNLFPRGGRLLELIRFGETGRRLKKRFNLKNMSSTLRQKQINRWWI